MRRSERRSDKGVLSPQRGPNRSAQGNALGSTECSDQILFALKGRHNFNKIHGFCRSFRAGEEILSAPAQSPGRCPGLSCSAPSGRNEGFRTASNTTTLAIQGGRVHPLLIPPKNETAATLPGGSEAVHAFRLGIEPFADGKPLWSYRAGSSLGYTGPCRANLESDPATLLQSRSIPSFSYPSRPPAGLA